MLTTASPRLATAGFDPLAVVRSARDLTLPDPAEIVRHADVARRVDAGLGAASDAVRGALDHLPGQRRRRRRGPFVIAGLLVGVLAAAGITIWWARRSAAAAARDVAVEDDELGLDQEALDRASDEGMPAQGVTIEGAAAIVPNNGAIHELFAVEPRA